MVYQYFFPPSTEERERASSAPTRFFAREFVRLAATAALVLAVLEVLWTNNIFQQEPVRRLYFIITWSLLMAAMKLLAARMLR
jgi:hypothetical protein